MDIGLPDGDGIQASQAIKKMKYYQTTPVVAVTAHLDEAGKTICLNWGLMQAVEYKPMAHNTLAALIDRYMTRAEVVLGLG